MGLKHFFGKIFSPVVYWNLAAMAFVFVAICIGLSVWMANYTHHGEGIDVPNVKGMLFSDADYELSKIGLVAIVSDSSYNRSLPAGTILEQTPGFGSRVKGGREIYLVVNAQQTPTLPVPDIADNCSLREAEAKLKALGFKLGPIEYAEGDKDWVYGVKCRGRNVNTGDRVPIDVPVVLVVGNNDSDFGEFYDDEDEFGDGETIGETNADTDDSIEI